MKASLSSLKLAAAAADESRELERLFFKHSSDGMILIRVERAPDGGARFFVHAENPAATARLESLGQNAEFAGKDVEVAFPAWLTKQVLIHYRECVTSGETRRYEVAQPKGGMAHESIATPVTGEDGAQYILVVMRDIRDRVQQEKQLNIALAQAEEANRSKSEFFASMSHELRTPLNAILGFSEMMEQRIGGALTEQHRQYVEYINDSGQHLLRLISDILDLSKMEAGQFKLHLDPCAIAPLCEECLRMVRETAQKNGTEIRVEIQPDLPLVMADPVRIKQILLNLISNAVKFTDRGRVTVEASYDAAGGFRLSVQDTGIGMTEEELSVALEPFGQVEDAYARNKEGTGLGLPIASHLAELHDGRLEIVSARGRGTKATLILPPERAVLVSEMDNKIG